MFPDPRAVAPWSDGQYVGPSARSDRISRCRWAGIRALRILPDGADRVAPVHDLALAHVDARQVRVLRADAPLLVPVEHDVLDHHDEAPGIRKPPRHHHLAGRHRHHRLAEIGVAAAATVPVLAGVDAQRVLVTQVRRDVPTLVAVPGRIGVRAAALAVTDGKRETARDRIRITQPAIERRRLGARRDEADRRRDHRPDLHRRPSWPDHAATGGCAQRPASRPTSSGPGSSPASSRPAPTCAASRA